MEINNNSGIYDEELYLLFEIIFLLFLEYYNELNFL